LAVLSEGTKGRGDSDRDIAESNYWMPKARQSTSMQNCYYLPVNYRYDKSKRQRIVISKGSYAINERYAGEEVDGEILWKASNRGSTSFDRKHMVLLNHFEGAPTSSGNCAWK